MTDESEAARWERIKSVFADALELPDGERAAFLEQAARDDPELGREVASLLEAHARAGPLMASPTLGPDDWGKPPRTAPAVRPEHLGRYRIRSLLGTGGMGEVYLAHDPLLDREVALKVLPADLAEHPQRRARFLQEARAAASLNHPNITTIHEIGEADGRDFIAFEYVEGRTLRERIAGRPMDLKALVDIASPLADALAHAHERGLVHRDIKSANVMVTARGLPKLLDFGLAKLVHARAMNEPDAGAGAAGASGAGAAGAASGSGGGAASDGGAASGRTRAADTALTVSGTISGTPEAMSPEQALGQPVDLRTDVFSFGSLLYEMAAGRAAFTGLGPQETLQAVIDSDPPSLRELRPDLPEEFLVIVKRALRKRPEERYQDLAELAADLRRLQRATDTGMFAAVPGDAGAAAAAAHAAAAARGGDRPHAGEMSRSGDAAGANSARRATVRALFAVAVAGVALLAWWQGWLPGDSPVHAAPPTGTSPPGASPSSTSAPGASPTGPSPVTTGGTPAAADSTPGTSHGGAPNDAAGSAPPAAPHQTAVMSFENTIDPEDPDQLAAMLGRLLSTHLSTGNGLPMLSQQRLYEVARELGHEDGRIDRSIATAVAQRAGVDTMILGQVGRTGDTLVATAEIVDVASGRTLGSHQARGTAAADVFAMAAALGRQVRDTLREPAMSVVEKHALEDQLTTSVEAFRAYIRGIEALQRSHPADAVESLRQATEIDPAFALAHYRLAMALVWTGRFDEIAPAIDRARAFSERLPGNLRLLLSAARPIFVEDGSRDALAPLLKALDAEPQDADALYLLSELYTHSATRNDAGKAVEMLERLLSLDRGISLVYEHLLTAYLRLGRTADAHGRMEFWKTLRPDNLAELEGTLALWEGRLTDATALLRDKLAPDVLADAPPDTPAAPEPPAVRDVLARNVSQLVNELSDVKGVYLSLSLDLRADVLAMHGRFAEAAELYQLAADVPGPQSLDGFFTSVRAASRHRLASLKALQGDLAGARADVAATLAVQSDSYRCLHAEALSALRDGDLAAAQRDLDLLGDEATRGWSPVASLYRDAVGAELALAKGHAEDARRQFAALVESGRLMEDWYSAEDSIGPFVRDGLARACLAAGDPAGAMQAWDDLLGCGFERLRHPLLWVSALHARGKLALQAGDEAGGRDFLERFLHCWGNDAADAAVTSLPQVIEARALLAALPPR